MRKSNDLCQTSTVLLVLGHSFFILGVILITVFANAKNKTIGLENLEIVEVIVCFLGGYLMVFYEWILIAKSNELYAGDADNVPSYLTKRLFGRYPYLFTFGQSNSMNQNASFQVHNYVTKDVRNSKFVNVFCRHVNKSIFLVFLFLSILLPFLIFNQSPSSFIKLFFQHIFFYVPYMYLILITWLSVLMIVIFRIYLHLTNKN
jgi:hypothetical protein